MDKTQRKVVCEKLHTNLIMQAVLDHEMYRMFTVHGGGLTEKEMMYLKKRLADSQQRVEELHKLWTRLNGST